jgi:para-aminobenzoate synthetase component 1
MPTPDPTPTLCRSLDDLSPVDVAARLRHLPGLVFFDSALESSPAARLSVIAARPVSIVRGHIDHDWERLREEVARHRVTLGADAPAAHGFAAGWVDYDGTFTFGIFHEALFFSHQDNVWRERGQLSGELRPESVTRATGAPVHFKPQLAAEEFREMVRRAQEYIAAGDIYQANLSHPFRAEFTADPFAFYEALRCYSPAPYASYLQLDGRTVLSSSPESFLHLSGSVIRTRPIKGTRPRRADPHADEKSAYDLLTSQKEIAELVMITDLERNDLGIVCEWGSVAVRELLALERYEHVFHLVSTVEGRLRPDVDHLDALKACFPGGSITGAPKKRAREIIAELEPFPRGLYTGAIGWFGFGGESQFNIAIRTVVIERGVATFHVGAGIVADSIPENEWQETLDKAAGILLAAERVGTG